MSLIDETLAASINLTGPQETLCLHWTNETFKHEQQSMTVNFKITGKNDKTFFLRHVRTVKLALPEQNINVQQLQKQYPYIGSKVESLVNATPKLIIGQDNWPLLVNRKIIAGTWNGPAVSKTLLGWVLHGNINDMQPSYQIVCRVHHDNRREKDEFDILHNLVKQQWQLENFDNHKKTISVEDKRAVDILNSTMKRIGDRYETGLLWRNPNIVLPESKTNALRRLECVERRMQKDKVFAEAYCKKMQDLEEKGYIRKISTEEANVCKDKIWYLPHFPVVNPNKPKKLRIVFDAAARSNGVSLNDCLLTGPDLYNSLNVILLNFRIKKYAFTADIKEMFLQIKVRDEDTSAQRILWRGTDKNKEAEIYEITVVFFGSVSGPCLAQEAKNRNAAHFMEEFPEAFKAITEQHYMDDYLGNADTAEEAKKLISDVITVHKKGGFTICNWIANNKEILQNVDDEMKADIQKNLEKCYVNTLEKCDVNTAEKILGVLWDPLKDNFQFDAKFHKIEKDILANTRKPTKREVLRVVMSVFDPLGFLSNFMVQGKILLQDIWRSQIGWDDQITEQMNEKWRVWLEDLQSITKLEIPRQYFTMDRQRSEIQLHIFSDALETAYAAVAYLQCQQDDQVEVAFVTAKAKVAPLKPISIPRLELKAALMAAEISNHLKQHLDLKISNIIHWTDSKTVLYWIRSEAKRFKSFVAQRIGEIEDLTNVADWKYVNSNNNVADEGTKRSCKMFSTKSNWLTGPEFLFLAPEKWPVENQEQINQDNLEVKQTQYVCFNTVAETSILPNPDRFSK